MLSFSWREAEHFLAFDVHCHAEENHADDEEDGDHADAGVDVAGDLADDANEGRAHEGCALAADIQKPEIFAGLLRRDNACEIGTRERLDAALEHADHDCQEPELPLMLEKDRENSDTEIREDADGDQLSSCVARCQPAEKDRERKSDDLRHQQRQEQAGGVEPKRGAVGCGHVDDRVDPVDVEKERQEEKENLFLSFDVFERAAQPCKAFAHGVLRTLDVMLLLVAFQERQRENQPPRSRDTKCQLHRQRHRDADGSAAEHQRQREDEWRAAADIAPGVAAG